MASELKRTIQERSIDTQLLVDHLLSIRPEETADYATLSKIIGRDVTASGSPLHSARRIAEREGRIVFGTIRKVGLKRLADSEIVTVGRYSLGRIHREAKRGANRLSCADYSKLSREAQSEHNATAAGLGALFAITGTPAQKKLLHAAEAATDRLSLQKTLSVFAGSNGEK